MTGIKRNIRYLQVPPRYPRNTVTEHIYIYIHTNNKKKLGKGHPERKKGQENVQ
jgi:hypothetical protein